MLCVFAGFLLKNSGKTELLFESLHCFIQLHELSITHCFVDSNFHMIKSYREGPRIQAVFDSPSLLGG